MPSLLVGTAETAGTNVETPAGVIEASKFTAAATGTLEEIWLRTGTGASTCTSLILGIYTEGSNEPHTPLGHATHSGTPGTSEWVKVGGFSVPVTVGTHYWLAWLPIGGGVTSLFVAGAAQREAFTGGGKTELAEETWTARAEDGTLIGGYGTETHEEQAQVVVGGNYIGRIRERPPLRLSVSVSTPGGLRARWGDDSANPQNVPMGMSFDTTMPGGFSRLGLTLERDPRIAYADLEELAMLTVEGPGSQPAWQGRLEKLPDVGGFERQITPEAVGYQAALEDDNSAREIYTDRELSRWEGPSTARELELLTLLIDNEEPSVGAGAPAPGETSAPSIITQITGPWARAHCSEAWYDAKGIPIGSLYYAWRRGATVEPDDTNWAWQTFLTKGELAEGFAEAESGNLRGAGPSSGTRSAPDALRTFALARAAYSAAGGSNGVQYPLYWTVLAVYGQHGLTLHGANGLTEAKGVLASDVTAHALGKWTPEVDFTVGAQGTIQPSSFVIPQLAFLEPTTVAEIVKQATRFELQDWAVWEGPTFWMNPRGERGNKWRARVGPAQLQGTGPQVSRLWNGVVVQYTDVAGKVRLVGPPGMAGPEPGAESTLLRNTDPESPLNQLGIRKWARLQMGTTTQAGAIQVGARFLQEQAALERSGQATLTGYVEDQAGNYWPAWEVRGGDQISFVDAADTSYRRVVGTSYDHDTKSNSIQLEQPPDSLQAVLERLSVVLLPLGVS